MLTDQNRRKAIAVLATCLLSIGDVWAEFVFRNLDHLEPGPWVEEEVVLPPFPLENNLREFYVSAVTNNRFFIDAATLSVGKDGVVRYVLVVRTGGGATNVTLEGIRCSSREIKLYATGHQDGRWVKARLDKWRPLENKQVNRHHAVLGRELFCAGGMPVKSRAEGEEALRLGRHPEAAGGGP